MNDENKGSYYIARVDGKAVGSLMLTREWLKKHGGSLRALCDACHEIELAEERNELPDQRWLDQLIDPGTSLGGARLKANVIDTDGTLYVAKFPS